eukprot:Pgem_evm1s17049
MKIAFSTIPLYYVMLAGSSFRLGNCGRTSVGLVKGTEPDNDVICFGLNHDLKGRDCLSVPSHFDIDVFEKNKKTDLSLSSDSRTLLTFKMFGGRFIVTNL